MPQNEQAEAVIPPTPDRILAFQLYRAYGDSAGWKNFQGAPMPDWDALPEAIRTHWTAAAVEARFTLQDTAKALARAQDALAKRATLAADASDAKLPGDASAREEIASLKGAVGIGTAIVLMHAGHRVRRAGWNGKGMWLALQLPDVLSKMSLPYVYMSTADGKLVPWLCSQTDLLAADWEVVE